ncbi:MAG: hypothetical protein A2284_06575 [Deltaproteobacteria bacterium RIFOXYA12_FULL_61_11]|nr:MAG: hypothetical protein A2284_06575 [Deltaproteobacteria bacterium RIFOXYA12_FULL_61_11]
MNQPGRTTLYDRHVAAGGKMVDFHGTCLPLRYTREVEEHLAVHERIGLFDVSHMGEIEVRGSKALPFLQCLTPNDLADLRDGQCRYNVLCREDGTAVDDIIVYYLAPERYMLCVNAANRAKDFDFLAGNAPTGLTIEDRSAEFDQLAVQGPLAETLLDELVDVPRGPMPPFTFRQLTLRGLPVLYSVTGYTGCGGAELYVDPERSPALWDLLLEAGKKYGLQPCGLGARDTLRLEQGYMLFGNDLRDDTTPIEAGLAWVVKFQKGAFNGREVMLAQVNGGLKRRIAGLRMLDKGIPRPGFSVFSQDRPAGTITSGTISPVLRTGIALGLLDPTLAPGAPIEVDIRGQRHPGEIVKVPFVPTRRRKKP